MMILRVLARNRNNRNNDTPPYRIEAPQTHGAFGYLPPVGGFELTSCPQTVREERPS